jgi:hypothetical protein
VSEARIVSANALVAKEIEQPVGLTIPFQAIDAARTLAYDAARPIFVFLRFEKEFRCL